MNVYRMSAWTHREPRVQAGFKAPKGEHAVMIAIGNMPADMPLTDEILLEMLRRTGLKLDGGEIWKEDWVGVKPEAPAG